MQTTSSGSPGGPSVPMDATIPHTAPDGPRSKEMTLSGSPGDTSVPMDATTSHMAPDDSRRKEMPLSGSSSSGLRPVVLPGADHDRDSRQLLDPMKGLQARAKAALSLFNSVLSDPLPAHGPENATSNYDPSAIINTFQSTIATAMATADALQPLSNPEFAIPSRPPPSGKRLVFDGVELAPLASIRGARDSPGNPFRTINTVTAFDDRGSVPTSPPGLPPSSPPRSSPSPRSRVTIEDVDDEDDLPLPSPDQMSTRSRVVMEDLDDFIDGEPMPDLIECPEDESAAESEDEDDGHYPKAPTSRTAHFGNHWEVDGGGRVVDYDELTEDYKRPTGTRGRVRKAADTDEEHGHDADSRGATPLELPRRHREELDQDSGMEVYEEPMHDDDVDEDDDSNNEDDDNNDELMQTRSDRRRRESAKNVGHSAEDGSEASGSDWGDDRSGAEGSDEEAEDADEDEPAKKKGRRAREAKKSKNVGDQDEVSEGDEEQAKKKSRKAHEAKKSKNVGDQDEGSDGNEEGDEEPAKKKGRTAREAKKSKNVGDEDDVRGTSKKKKSSQTGSIRREHQEMIDEFKDKTDQFVSKMAKLTKKSPALIAQMLRPNVPQQHRARNIWDIFSSWYAKEQPKRNDESRAQFMERLRKEYQRQIQHIEDKEKREEAIQKYLDWRGDLEADYLDRLSQTGGLKQEFNRGVAEVNNIARHLYHSLGLHVFGYVIDAHGPCGFTMFGGSPEWEEIKKLYVKDHFGTMANYQAVIRVIELRKAGLAVPELPLPTRNGYQIPVQNEGESPRDYEHRTFKYLMKQKCVENGVVIETYRFPWAKILEFLAANSLRIVNMHPHFVLKKKPKGGYGFNFRGENVDVTIRQIVEPFLSENALGSKFSLEPWSDEEYAKAWNRKADLPLILGWPLTDEEPTIVFNERKQCVMYRLDQTLYYKKQLALELRADKAISKAIKASMANKKATELDAQGLYKMDDDGSDIDDGDMANDGDVANDGYVYDADEAAEYAAVHDEWAAAYATGPFAGEEAELPNIAQEDGEDFASARDDDAASWGNGVDAYESAGVEYSVDEVGGDIADTQHYWDGEEFQYEGEHEYDEEAPLATSGHVYEVPPDARALSNLTTRGVINGGHNDDELMNSAYRVAEGGHPLERVSRQPHGDQHYNPEGRRRRITLTQSDEEPQPRFKRRKVTGTMESSIQPMAPRNIEQRPVRGRQTNEEYGASRPNLAVVHTDYARTSPDSSDLWWCRIRASVVKIQQFVYHSLKRCTDRCAPTVKSHVCVAQRTVRLSANCLAPTVAQHVHTARRTVSLNADRVTSTAGQRVRTARRTVQFDVDCLAHVVGQRARTAQRTVRTGTNHLAPTVAQRVRTARRTVPLGDHRLAPTVAQRVRTARRTIPLGAHRRAPSVAQCAGMDQCAVRFNANHLAPPTAGQRVHTARCTVQFDADRLAHVVREAAFPRDAGSSERIIKRSGPSEAETTTGQLKA
ncbi:hypothetical protein PUNSTDRAFT_139549 [Punctularia strigosozonata HHB-11173 SS5]|uniref:Uncharacterized protein n=1 Tax=Punctularia strigosozonata (strain HHB-11173) TaxID=741275 RepID=R7RZ93_PUNST|nr:uncharacterized protein PUNSTDRAFT_139549 [Punctularia strigosozonata HHB-11173 SS5]EIN03440.1 hypothetical protein PUNSTDRAFT_139549 [Punctularia strigosozonata HHB-11173 SS5]